MKVRFLASLSLALAALMAAPVGAQSYPNKPVRLVVPFAPGGSTDIIARSVAQELSTLWGTQMIVENRPGAGGTIGAGHVAASAADGYTLMFGHVATLAVNPSMYPKLSYDPATAFSAVSMVAILPIVVVVNAALPVKSVAELIAYAQARPGVLNYSSGGNGSATHLAVESFKRLTKTDMVHVPYKGTGPAIVDLLAGHIGMTIVGAETVIAHLRSGKLRALAVTSPKRLEALPQIPTMAESGWPNFEASPWFGVVAPGGTPPAIIAKLNADINKVMGDAETTRRLAANGILVSTGTSEQFGTYIKSEMAHWAGIIKAGNIKMD